MVEFRMIDEDNFYDVIGMTLENDDFVASNVYSLAEAWLSKGDMMPYAVYKDNTLVGFIMPEKTTKKADLASCV